MKIIFTTDLHGTSWKYQRILELAQKLKVDAVVNGGDLLPVNSDLTVQKDFILNFLDDYFHQYESSNIYHLSVMGNTDFKCFDPLFNEITSNYDYTENLSARKVKIDEYEFIGTDLMPDYPFRLKDRCRLDNPHDEFPEQCGKGLLSSLQGWEDIEDWFNYAKKLPTLKEELDNLPHPENVKKAVYVMHMPPAFTGLDVCQGNVTVGSKSIYHFFRNKQPLLSLHGHIHESPKMSRIWNSNIKNTTCIQPGQDNEDLVYVMGNLEEMEFQRFIEIEDLKDSSINRRLKST
ncbi:MAG: metallophosphoesterase [Methanobacterium sp.]|nr:metallophosphoesterase [Methanobacterium sp.]